MPLPRSSTETGKFPPRAVDRHFWQACARFPAPEMDRVKKRDLQRLRGGRVIGEEGILFLEAALEGGHLLFKLGDDL